MARLEYVSTDTYKQRRRYGFLWLRSRLEPVQVKRMTLIETKRWRAFRATAFKQIWAAVTIGLFTVAFTLGRVAAGYVGFTPVTMVMAVVTVCLAGIAMVNLNRAAAIEQQAHERHWPSASPATYKVDDDGDAHRVRHFQDVGSGTRKFQPPPPEAGQARVPVSVQWVNDNTEAIVNTGDGMWRVVERDGAWWAMEPDGLHAWARDNPEALYAWSSDSPQAIIAEIARRYGS
jgi:hypothetical protein